MLFRMFATAISATILSATLAGAQGVSQLGGPRNQPPAGFTGQQFVDSDGCVFLRAGYGGQVTWVPRVKANRRPMCGFPPTFGAEVAAAVAAATAPEPQVAAPAAAPTPPVKPPVVAQPAQTQPAPAQPVLAQPVLAQPVLAQPVLAQPVLAQPAPAKPAAPLPAIAPPVVQPVAAPTYTAPRRSLLSMLFGQPALGNPIPLVPVPAPQPPAAQIAVQQPALPPATAQRRYATQPTTAQAQCAPAAPVLETVLLRTGGTAMVCTRGDGTLTGWLPPLFPQGMVGAALTPRMMAGAQLHGTATQMAASNAIPKPPKGYKLAWKDDRLNPMRGIGTATGQAQQDQVWTRQIPAVLAATPQAAPQPRVAVSTMSAPANDPAQPTAAGPSYVQVGTFGQPANADGVRARLAALGLPVSTSKITRKGKVLQIVYAGPFATKAEAQSALATTHGAGYGDAILK